MASLLLRVQVHTRRRATVIRNPLDEWSARRTALSMTTHNTHNTQPSTWQHTTLTTHSPLHDNTQHSQHTALYMTTHHTHNTQPSSWQHTTNTQAPCEIHARKLKRWKNVSLRHRTRGHWHWQNLEICWSNLTYRTFINTITTRNYHWLKFTLRPLLHWFRERQIYLQYLRLRVLNLDSVLA
jgi:hypothetical protein